MSVRDVFHFGDCRLDVGERRLLRGGEVVRVSPKAYDVLVALVRQPGQLVTKEELLQRVWPESFVEEGILTVHVSALRKALGDDTRPAGFIETVARSGYRFVASVTRETDDGGRLLTALPRPVELYEWVGRGRSHLLSASFFELPDAVSAFRAAIDIDPTYGPAHAGLALARCAQGAMPRRAPPRGVCRSQVIGATRAGDG